MKDIFDFFCCTIWCVNHQLCKQTEDITLHIGYFLIIGSWKSRYLQTNCTGRPIVSYEKSSAPSNLSNPLNVWRERERKKERATNTLWAIRESAASSKERRLKCLTLNHFEKLQNVQIFILQSRLSRISNIRWKYSIRCISIISWLHIIALRLLYGRSHSLCFALVYNDKFTTQQLNNHNCRA